MPLSNAQYDEIMHEYDERQLHNRHVLETRRAEVLKKLPRLKEIDASVASSSVRQARLHLDGDTNALASLKQELSALSLERQQLLTASGYPADYLDPVYTCPDCKDSGYIDGKKCHCFKQAIINTVYAQSNIRQILRIENFDNFRYDFYSKEEKNPLTGLSSYETAQKAVRECHYFIDDFDHKPKNLLFYGKTGVGKTFLTNCIAKSLLDKGYTVLYLSAINLFDNILRDIIMKNSHEPHQEMLYDYIYNCDFLIIDDLGTELTNSFVQSQLFEIINRRSIRRLSTLISTNLDLQKISERYTERIMSRIVDSYLILNLYGDNIRYMKRMKHITKQA